MKKRTLVCFGLLALLVVLGIAAQVVPVAVSPGRARGVAVVGELCPTFSWTSVDWAVGYRIEVFEALGVAAVSYEQMASSGTIPVLTKEIEGRGLSWTPSSEEGLPTGGMYVWYVEAMSPSGPGMWSSGRVFIVSAVAAGTETEAHVTKVLREKGIREEVITDVLKEMKGGVTGTVAGEIGTHPSGNVRAMGTEGASNTFYGLEAGKNNSTGVENSFFGRSAGITNTGGSGNTFQGYSAGVYNSTGYFNTFLGDCAGESNTIGHDNVFLGYFAGFSHTSAYYNTFLGSMSGYYTSTGYDNTFLGYYAGYHNMTGSANTFVGKQAGNNNVVGQGNVFLGYNAGASETGSNKLYIANSDTSTPLIYGEFDNAVLGVSGKFGVGTKTPTYPMELKTTGRNATFVIQRTEGGAINFVNATLSYGQFGTGNNYPVRLQVNNAWKMQLDNDNSLTMASGATCTAGGVWTNASSRELKENIEGLTPEEAAAALEVLAPVKYNYKADKAERHVGFIAEEVPDLVASKDRKTLSPMDVVAVLTKVVQEQQKTIAELKTKVEELRNKEKTEK